MFKNLSIRSKLGVLLLPLLAILVVFAAVVVQPRLSAARSASRSEALTDVAESGATLYERLADERGLSGWLLAGNESLRGATLDEARAEVDREVAGLRDRLAGVSAADREMSTVVAATTALDRLGDLRARVDAGSAGAEDSVEAYSEVATAVVELTGALATVTDDTDLARTGAATFNFMRFKEQYASTRDAFVVRLQAGTLRRTDLTDLVSADARGTTYLNEFKRNASAATLSRYDLTSKSAQNSIGRSLINDLRTTLAGGSEPTIGAEEWWNGVSGYIDALATVEGSEFDLYREAAADTAAANRNDALRYGVLAGAAVVLAASAAMFLSRSLVRRLRSITTDAHTIAHDRLPEVLQALRNPNSETLAAALPQVASDAGDEIGILADSFNTVLRVSVETGIDHAQQRARTVTDMLVNLGRRNQALIDRQLTLLDELEARHEDPELLERLFEVDHMVTRMRRNAENLLVLAGHQQPRDWSSSVPLSEVLEGAASESPDLARVELQPNPDSDPAVAGGFAVDVSHIVAELVENAVAYSSPATTVVLRAEPATGGAHRVWIIDNGVGMTTKELSEANQRLLQAADVDTIETDRVGFQVVSRMAHRIGVTVELQANPAGGIAACVTLPGRVFDGYVGDEQDALPRDASSEASGKGGSDGGDVFKRVDTRRDTAADIDAGLLDDAELDALRDAATAATTGPRADDRRAGGSTGEGATTRPASTEANEDASGDTGDTGDTDAGTAAPAKPALAKRQPGTAYAGNDKAAAADAGAFRRLPQPDAPAGAARSNGDESAGEDEDQAFGRFRAMSALQSAVAQGRQEASDPVEDPQEDNQS